VSLKSSLLLAGASLIAFNAYADEAVTIPQIVISASRFPQPITQVASSMTVITREQIEKKNKSTVTELLREVPGVTVANNGGASQPTSIFLRGTESRHVLVVMDGVSLNDPSDPSDRFDFSNLSTDNIERIEILRGAQSTLYGSQAIGGVINIVSRQGRGEPRYDAKLEYGSFNTRKVNAGTNGEMGRTSYSLSAGNTHTSGLSSLAKRYGGFEKDSGNSYTFATNIASKLTDIFTAKFNLRYNRTNTEFDSPGVFSFIAPRPADDYAPINDNRQINGRAAGELALFDGKWKQELGLSALDVNRNSITSYYDSVLGDSPFGKQHYMGCRQKIDWVHHVQTASGNTVTLGTEAWKDSFKTETLRERDVGTHAYFIDDQWTLTNAFSLNGGARIDDHQTFGRQFTWKLAPVYYIAATGTRLKATYGTGFKAPSLSDLFSPDTGNPHLLPERSKGWDAGFEQSVWNDKLTFGSTFFRNDIENLLGNSNVYPFPSINVGKARTEGAESVITMQPTVKWKFTMSHVYTLSQNRKNISQPGNLVTDLLRRPRHQGKLDATYDYSSDGDIGVNIRYESSRRDGDIVTFAPLYVKAFTTVDMHTNYRLTPNVALYGRGENLLDKRYEEVAGYTQPGLAVYGGVKINY